MPDTNAERSTELQEDRIRLLLESIDAQLESFKAALEQYQNRVRRAMLGAEDETKRPLEAL